MKRQYLITIEKDEDDGMITFTLDMPDGAALDYEDISDMLVQVAQTIYEETQPLDNDFIH